jgi:hypothetical protein
MVFGLFSKDKSSAVAKTVERATNKLSQQADRLGALEKLRDDGSEDALQGLCKRWSVTSSKGVEDEFEKNWVVDALVSHGTAAMAPLQKFMKSAEQLSFALRVVERISQSTPSSDVAEKIPASKSLAFVDELLASEPPGYTRHPERRIDLIRWLAEWSAVTSEQVVPRLAPYLADFDENVRFAAIDGLSAHEASLIAEPIAQAMSRTDEESGRIRRTLAELIATKKLPLGDKAGEVAAVLTGPLSQFRVVDGTLVG